MHKCKHCNQEFDISNKPRGWMANHSRWCDMNAKRQKYVDRLKSNDNVLLMNAAKKRTGKTNRYTKARLEDRAVPSHSRKGLIGFKGTPHTEETIHLLRQKALASPHRRLVRGICEYKGVRLDSSWELVLAKRLDEQSIEWNRPNPIPWVDNEQITHNYFPDFYLPEYDLFLDPKNPYAIKAQKKKLDCLLLQYKNIVILDTLEKCKNYTIDIK